MRFQLSANEMLWWHFASLPYLCKRADCVNTADSINVQLVVYMHYSNYLFWNSDFQTNTAPYKMQHKRSTNQRLPTKPEQETTLLK